jgi:hypothetical protein
VARKYYGQFTSIAGVVHRVEIWDAPSGSTSSGTELRLVSEGYQIERQGEGDLLFENRVKKSKATAFFAIDNNTDAAYFEDMAIDEEGSHAMIIYKNNTVVWIGRILGDLFSWQRSSVEGKRIYEITSVDTLSLLDNYKIQASWFTSGKITLLHLITSILKTTELDAYWTAISRSGYFVADALLTYETSAGTNYRMPRMRINASSLIENYDPTTAIVRQSDNENEDNITCLEALNRVLGSFAAYIILENGMFFIHQYAAYTQAIIYDIYSTSEALTQTNASIVHEHTIQNDERPFFQAFPTHSYQPPIKNVKLTTFKAVSKKVAKPWRTPYNNSHLAIGPVTMTQGKSVKFDYRVVFEHNGRDIYILKIKAWAVERISGNTYVWNGSAWVLTATINYTDIKLDKGPGPQSTSYYGQYSVPDNGLITGFDFYFDMYMIRNLMTPGSYGMVDEPFTGSITCYQEITENLKTYTNTINTKASKIIDLESYFYDAMGADGIGTIQVYNGTTWQNSANWVAPGTGTGSFESILVQQVLGYYAKAVKSINCNVRDDGTFNGLKTLFFDSSAWVNNGYTYSASSENYDGEWLKLYADYDAVTGGEIIYNNDPKNQLQFRVQSLESDVKGMNTVDSFMYKSVSQAIFYDKGNTNPNIDSTYNVNIKYDPVNYTSEFQIFETGAAVNLTTGTHSVNLEKEIFVCDTSSGNVTLNLPSADTVKGQKFIIKKSQLSNSVTINGDIDGLESYALTSLNESVIIESDGSTYWAIADNKAKPSTNSNVLIDGGSFTMKNSFIDAGGFVTE